MPLSVMAFYTMLTIMIFKAMLTTMTFYIILRIMTLSKMVLRKWHHNDNWLNKTALSITALRKMTAWHSAKWQHNDNPKNDSIMTILKKDSIMAPSKTAQTITGHFTFLLSVVILPIRPSAVGLFVVAPFQSLPRLLSNQTGAVEAKRGSIIFW